MSNIKIDNVSYICDKLTTTYNTNILDLASDDIKDKFLLTSLTHRDGNEGKKVLMNLICNHFNKDSDKQKPTPRFIGGPKNLTVHYSKKYNKMIYIFGEYHSDIVDCDTRFGDESTKEKWDEPNSKKMRVEYFLSEFIRTTDVFLDIFLEFPIIPKKEGKYHDYLQPFPANIRLNKLLENFKKCLQRDTRTEVCKLARIHFFDIRLFDNRGKLTSTNKTNSFYYKLNNILIFKDKDKKLKRLRLFVEDKVIKEVLFDLSHPDVEEFKKIWINHLTDLSYNKKELERLENDDPKMKDTILHFIQKEITETVMKYRDMWKKNVNIVLKNDEYTDAEFIDAFTTIKISILTVNAIYTDLYTLLRIFKTFNMSEMKEKAYKEATDQPDKAHNIIIYGGDFHSQTYRKFFTDILNFENIEVAGKEEPYKKRGEKMYCIDMKTIKQPLFSKYHELDRVTDESKHLVKLQEDILEEKRQADIAEIAERKRKESEKEQERIRSYLEEKRVKDEKEAAKRQVAIAEIAERKRKENEKEQERRREYIEEQRIKDAKEQERRREYFEEKRIKYAKEAAKRQVAIAEIAERKRKESEKEQERIRSYLEEKRVKDEKEAAKRQVAIAEIAERKRKESEKEQERRRKYFEEQRIKDHAFFQTQFPSTD